MTEVKAETVIEAPQDEVDAHLSPKAIMEYEQTYEVDEIEERGDHSVVTTSADEDTGMVVRFEESPEGYVYEQIEGGFFEELETTVTVSEVTVPSPTDDQPPGTMNQKMKGPVRVEFRSSFTFGGRLAPFIDWLAKRHRKSELERALLSLETAVKETTMSDRG